MIEEVLVLSASPYNFADQATGEIRKGLTLFVCHINSVQNDVTIGCKPTKYSLPYESLAIFENQSLPAVAEMAWNFDFNRMKPVPTTFENFKSIRDEINVGS